MTTTAPVPHHAPVTPPPESTAFLKMPHNPEHEEPFSMKAFQDPAFQNAQLKFLQAQSRNTFSDLQQPPLPSASPNAVPQQATAAADQSSTQRPHALPAEAPPNPFDPAAIPPQADQAPRMTSSVAAAAAAAALDPKYLAMVSRIASYYQQRCQAVANYQQQRCQAWATMHRQKCQEMVQAAMLVVAWYIRDRIQRRRRRQKRRFRKGLSERCGRPRITKGEVVRRWVLQVPESAPVPSEASRLVDKEEVDFNMDREVPLDKDSKLFSVADNLIKSQLSKIEVPLMGALSFDESESESEEECHEPEKEEEDEDYDRERNTADDMEDAEEEMYDDEDMSLDSYGEDELGSNLVQNGTGNSSRPKDESTIS